MNHVKNYLFQPEESFELENSVENHLFWLQDTFELRILTKIICLV
jgi:hypothetical protein